MGRRSDELFAVLLACVSCNAAPPVPDNPVPRQAPDLGPTTAQSVTPPPISGGTMLLSQDGKTAIAADSDRDFVSFVDISSGTVRARADLTAHDEPGRLVEDTSGLVYVALRGSGELATLALSTGRLVGRRAVCAQPRGVAYDGKTDQILVACATGELVTLPAGSGPAAQVRVIEPDLRDVVIEGDSIFVSKFRAAEILRITRNGDIAERAALPALPLESSPAMAWRMRLTADHELHVAYQLDSTSFVPTTPGGYGNSGAGAIVRTVIASLSTQDLTKATPMDVPEGNVLPVDLAFPPADAVASSLPVLIAAGNWRSAMTAPYAMIAARGSSAAGEHAAIEGQLIATEVRQDGTILLQSREPARLYVVRPGQGGAGDVVLSSITLSDVSREDTGHTIFHTNSGGSVACASCHGEGGDDAQTWNFDGTKPRRTPSLLGTVKGTAPYHWDADFADLQALSHEVYTRRMGGRLLERDQVSALQGWLEQLPVPRRPSVDSAARARGEALFQGKGACSSCHSGLAYTNNATVDVGTGARLQVPPLLGLGAHGPFMHSGCAKTLTERFTRCGTTAHGQTSSLTSDEIRDLVTFLEAI